MRQDRKALQGRLDLRLALLTLTCLLSLVAACGDDAEASSDAGGAGSGASQAGEIDACAIVTQQDASELFGQPAVREQGTPIVDPALIGECLWTYEEEDEIGSVSSQLLQFYVWDGPMYHSVPPSSEPFAVGQEGYLAVSDAAGVDIGWIQDGHSILFSYFSIGDTMPTHASMVEPMKALALEVSDRL